MTITTFAEELNIPEFLDNSCTFSIMLKYYYDSDKILHKCHKMSDDNMVMYISNGDIKEHFLDTDPPTC